MGLGGQQEVLIEVCAFVWRDGSGLDRCNLLVRKLRHCLLSEHELDVRQLLREGISAAGVQTAIQIDLQTKLERHRGAEGLGERARTMSQIGG